MHPSRRTAAVVALVAIPLLTIGFAAGYLAGSGRLQGASIATRSDPPTGSEIDGSPPNDTGASPNDLATPSPRPAASGQLTTPSNGPTGTTAVEACPVSASPDAFSLRVPILMYHRIVPVALAGDSLEQLVIPPRLFSAQLAALRAARWRTMTLAALASDVVAGRRPPARTFVITIDDGHDDGFANALPILRRNRDVATYFIVTGRLNHPGNLTDVEVQRLASAGMEIGDHTVSHADLPALPIATAQRQIEIAAESIARLVGRRPTSFAYPYGAYDHSVAALVRQDGFSMAVTTQECAFESGTTAMLTPRIRVGPSTTPLRLVSELEAIGRRPLPLRSS